MGTGTRVALETGLGIPPCLSFPTMEDLFQPLFPPLSFFSPFPPVFFLFSPLLFYFPPFLFFSPDTAVWEPAGPFPSPESGLSAPEPPAPRPPAEGRNHYPPLRSPPFARAPTAQRLGANWDGRSIPPLPQPAGWGHPMGFFGGNHRGLAPTDVNHEGLVHRGARGGELGAARTPGSPRWGCKLGFGPPAGLGVVGTPPVSPGTLQSLAVARQGEPGGGDARAGGGGG